MISTYSNVFGQNEIDSAATDYKPLSKITWNGYFRSYFYYRNMKEKYFDTPGGDEWYKLNGGYNEPLLRLNAKASPAPNTNIEIEYTFDNLLTGSITGQGAIGQTGKVSLPLQSIRFNADYNSKFGSFRLQAGGLRFYSLTPLIFGGFVTRYDPFERVPWTGEDHPWTRYNKLYGKSQNVQAANSRFGSAIFQGVILEGRGLPGGFGINSIFGKSINSGGYQTWIRNNPKKVQAHRIYKKFSNLFVGLNYYNSFGNISETSRLKEVNNVTTSNLELNFDGIALSGEFGYGDYYNPVVAKSGSSIIKADVSISERKTWLNIDLQYFRMGVPIVNQSSELINTSISSASNEFGDSSNIGNGYLPGVVTDFRQLSNNRQGFNFKLSKDLDAVKVSIGIGASQELENLYNAVSFQHRLNKDARSRFNVFSSGVGPYSRITSIYLTTYETIGITTANNDYLKSFKTIDFTFKYKAWLLGKEVIFMNYTNYNTVQDQFSALPGGGNQFINVLYSDITTFVHLTPQTVFLAMVGIENVNGGVDTDLATNGKPVEQMGTALGLGLDVQLNNRAGLYLRQRWFAHKDKNFTDDKFNGSESSVELKIFF